MNWPLVFRRQGSDTLQTDNREKVKTRVYGRLGQYPLSSGQFR